MTRFIIRRLLYSIPVLHRDRVPRLRAGPGHPGRPVHGHVRREGDPRAVRRSSRSATAWTSRSRSSSSSTSAPCSRATSGRSIRYRPAGLGHPRGAPAGDRRADDRGARSSRPSSGSRSACCRRPGATRPSTSARWSSPTSACRPRSSCSACSSRSCSPSCSRTRRSRCLPQAALSPGVTIEPAGRGLGPGGADRAAADDPGLRLQHVHLQHDRDDPVGRRSSTSASTSSCRPSPSARSRSRSSPG